MNYEAIKELRVILLITLLVIATVLFLFRLKKLSIFILILSAFTGGLLIIAPIIHKADIKKHNEKIAGVYKLIRADTLSMYSWKGYRVSESCRIILSENLEFKIENCPTFISDSTGYWTWASDGNYFSVHFTDKNKKGILGLRQDVPYQVISVRIEENRDLVFTKVR